MSNKFLKNHFESKYIKNTCTRIPIESSMDLEVMGDLSFTFLNQSNCKGFIILFMVTQIDDAVVAFLSLTFFMTDITLRSY